MSSVNLLYTEIKIPPVLNPETICDLNEQLILCLKQNVRFVVFTGNDSVFCNGLDLKWVASSKQKVRTEEMQKYASFLKKIQTEKFISISLVCGSVSGGGLGIVCASDYVLVEDSSTFSLPEGLLGLIPGMILPSLLNRISPQQIKKMVFTGKKYPASFAIDCGIADEVVNINEIQETLIQTINSMRSCKIDSVTDIKEMLYESHLSQDSIAEKGMDILSKRLQEPEIEQRIKDISDFLED